MSGFYANIRKQVSEGRKRTAKIPEGRYKVRWDNAVIGPGQKNPEAINAKIEATVWDRSSEAHKRKVNIWFAFGAPEQSNLDWVIRNRQSFWALLANIGVPVDKITCDEDLEEWFDRIAEEKFFFEINVVHKKDSQYPNIYIVDESIEPIWDVEPEFADDEDQGDDSDDDGTDDDSETGSEDESEDEESEDEESEEEDRKERKKAAPPAKASKPEKKTDSAGKRDPFRRAK